MTSNAASLMTAGRFSSMTLLSAKALRIYAERGLIQPRFIDPANGYRYYAADQAPTGWLIGLLRSADLSLDEIDKIVHADRRTGLELLDLATTDLTRRTEARLTVLDRARLHLLEEVNVSLVNTTLVVDQPVLSVMSRMKPHEMMGIISATLDRLRALAAEAGQIVTGDPFGVFHAPITDDSDGPLEMVLPVDRLVDRDDDVRCYRMPGGLLATREAEGRETHFPEILGLYDEVHSWITAVGRVPVGPPREIWHRSPYDPEPMRLTVAWPYATPPA